MKFKKNQKKIKHSPRTALVYILFISFLLLTLYRLLSIQYFKYNFYENKGKQRHEKTQILLPERGDILDRNNNILATDTAVYKLILDPRYININKNIDKTSYQEFLLILNKLNIKNTESINNFNNYLNKLKNQKIKFKILAKNLTPKQMQDIKKLNVSGISFEKTLKRFYPGGKRTSTLLGYINHNNQGVEGVELKYNKQLIGLPGEMTSVESRNGKIIQLKKDNQATHGKAIKLTIDKNIQYLTYKALEQTSIKYKAKSASAIIMDIKTGEIFAMTNYPGFNPNNNSQKNINRKNNTISDLFEPGSTIKPFAITSALISKKYTPNSIINTSPGIYEIGKHKIQDIRNFGKLTVTEVLKKSSNIGTAKILLSLNNNNFINLLENLKFASKSNLNLSGESTGYIPTNKKLDKFSLATLGFGYGLNCNLLQLTTAYAILANNGKLVTPIIDFKNKNKYISQIIIPEKISKQIIKMLITVTEPGGTATRARIKGYKIAGKTGTSKIAIKGGYTDNSYQSLFVGIAPANNPKYAMTIIINKPSGKYYYGGIVAAPVFAQVMPALLSSNYNKI